MRDNIDGELAETVPEDIVRVKEKYGVPEDLRSCHTLVLEDYVVEGHVPVQVIGRLLTETPSIDGVALPGMPAGTPGMGGTKQGPWTVYAIGGEQARETYVEL
ncbi:DUF411 domain-containing protein [Halogranum amylolyticum]|uniref:DUF411 domain-containing protein n=1 Tax=Halogranum amylolyticum TaxID=660520 RepID=UPI001FCD3878|nr:DUF411 domain-containing protein [Halogranum amylolyticum]